MKKTGLALLFLICEVAYAQNRLSYRLEDCSDHLIDLQEEELRHRQLVVIERFLRPQKEMEKVLVTLAATLGLDHSQPLPDRLPLAFIDALVKNDLRRFVFQLEAGFRLYQDVDPILEHWRTVTRRFEDHLGDLVDFKEDLDRVAKLGVPELLGYFQGRVEAGEQTLKRILISDHWLRGLRDAFEQMTEALKEVRWFSQKDDKEFIIHRLLDQIQEIRKTPYDMAQLESGVHKLRRDLRWLLIYVHFLIGKIEINQAHELSSDDPIYVLLEGRTPVEKYLRFYHSPRVKRPLSILEAHYLALGNLVNEFSKIKEQGRMEVVLVEAYLRLGFFKTKQEAQEKVKALLKPHHSSQSFMSLASKLYADLKASKLLESLEKELKKQLK